MYFVVTSRQGPGWDRSKPMREQQLWDEHAAFINGLIDDGVMLLGGPVAVKDDEGFSPTTEPVGDEHVYRAMIVVQADDAADATRRLAEDPWLRAGVLEQESFDRWHVLVGELEPPSE